MLETLRPDWKRPSAARWGCLPPRMRLLFIAESRRRTGWLNEAFATDSATEIQLEEAISQANGIERIRDGVFDAIIVSHEPEQLDAFKFLGAVRAGNGEHQPTLVLGDSPEHEMRVLSYEVGAGAYVCINHTSTRELMWQLARVIERHELIAENRRLLMDHKHRLQLDHEEATRLLEQQHELVKNPETLYSLGRAGPSHPRITPCAGASVPDSLVAHYKELLQTYVIMGSGNLSSRIETFSSQLANLGITAQQSMQMHLQVLEQVVNQRKSRSARHVVNRADLLLLDVLLHLCEEYQQLWREKLPLDSQAA